MISKNQKENLIAWWNNEDIGKPIFLYDTLKENSVIPDTDDLHTFWIDPEFHMDKAIQTINNTDYYGESVPYHYVNFGGLPLCACLGGELEFVDKDATWNKTFINSISEFKDLQVAKDNRWWKLIKEVTKKSVALSKNHHYVTHCAFSGIGDVVSGCLGIDKYMISLITEPEEVKRASAHMMGIWKQLFDETNHIIGNNDGYVSSWTGIWAPGTTFPIQEDISYMISPDMFREFALPYIDEQTHCMDYAMYHLDGKGQIPFVDDIAALPNMRAIQWLPGAGQWEIPQWLELIKHIKSLDVALQMFAHSIEDIELLIKEVGTKGLLITVDLDDREEHETFIDTYCN